LPQLVSNSAALSQAPNVDEVLQLDIAVEQPRSCALGGIERGICGRAYARARS